MRNLRVRLNTYKSLGALFVILAAFLWSLDGLLRRSLYTLPPAVVVFYEHLFGAIVILPFFLPRRGEVRVLKQRDWLTFIAIAFFSGTLGTIFFTAALGKVQFIPFSVVILLQQLQPIFAITLAALLLRERITRRFLLLAVLAIAGAYLVTFPDLRVNLATGGETVVAALLSLGAALFWGSSTVLSKYVLGKLSYWVTTAVRFFLTVPIALSVVFVTGGGATLTALTIKQILTLVAITFSTGLVALTIYYYGLKRIPARVSTICELFFPFSAVVLDFLVNRVVLSPTQLLGAGLLLVSIYNVSLKAKSI